MLLWVGPRLWLSLPRPTQQPVHRKSGIPTSRPHDPTPPPFTHTTHSRTRPLACHASHIGMPKIGTPQSATPTSAHAHARARTSDGTQIVANTSHVSATQAPGADAMRTCRHDESRREQRATNSHVAATQRWTRPAPVCLRMAPPDVLDESLCAARLACLPATVPLGVAASSAPALPPPHPVVLRMS